jgi:hypothetical protein
MDFPIGGVADVRGLLNDLRHGFEGKVQEDFINDGAAARHGRANGDSRGAQFANASVAKPLLTEFLAKAAGLAEVSAARPDALADVDDGRVTLHFFAQRFYPGINVANLA